MSLDDNFSCGTYSNGFVHSIKVPKIYKTAASIVKRVVENGESLKRLVYGTRHKNIKGVYALVVETIKHSKKLDDMLKKSKLLVKESRLDPWLARILITEMIFRNKELKGTSKPIQTVLSYRRDLEKGMCRQKEGGSFEKEKKPRYVRVNTLLNTTDEIIKVFRNEGWILIPTPSEYADFLLCLSQLKEDEFVRDFHIKELLAFHTNAQFYKNQLYRDGSIILQDKASCLPVCLLRPPTSAKVLDMCAAPGMKTSHLSARMKNKGSIYAVEMNSNRYNTLCEFVSNSNCKNVQCFNMDALTIGVDNQNPWQSDIEYILVDPSCSGTGIVQRKNIFGEEDIDEVRLKKLCAFQFKLLLHALTNFPKAKRVVYSTCSTRTVENEKVVEDVLRRIGTTQQEDPFVLIEAMKDAWPTRGSESFDHGKFCIFADPEKDLTNGFFIAVFERASLGVKNVN